MDTSIENCPICLEPFTESLEIEPVVQKIDCEHVFHTYCLSEWLKVGVPGNCCPVCRSEILEKEAHEESSSGSQEDPDELSSAPSDSGSEEPPQQQEEVSQPVVQPFMEAEQGFIELQTHINTIQTNYELLRTRVQEYASGFLPSTPNEQEKVEKLLEILSTAQIIANNAQDCIEEAEEIISWGSEPLDQTILSQAVNDLSDLFDCTRQHALKLAEIYGRVQNLQLFQNVMGSD